MARAGLPLAMALLLAAAPTTAPAAAETVHVHAGHLLDPATGGIASDVDVVVSDGVVTAVAPWGPPAGGATVVDWSRYWVLPGLIDMHTHIADGFVEGNDPAEPLKHSETETALKAVGAARATLEAGFTSVRDVGVYRGLTDVELKHAIAAGDVVGPRMTVAGGYITIPGGGGAVTGAVPGTVIPPAFRIGYVRSPAEARARVAYLLGHGADFIKLIATGAVLAMGSEPGALELTPAEMRAACDEAEAHGSYCIAHAHGAAGIRAAIAAGARSIEHASLIDDAGIAMAKARGVWLDMDIYDGDWIEAVGTTEHWPAEYLAKNRATTDEQRAGFAKAVKAGARLSFGTDAGVYPHGLNARQFAYMVRFGMTPLEAIRAATTESAVLLRQAGKAGCVAAGCFGDMIALAADPLADVTALEHVAGVIKGGAVVKAVP